MHYYQFNIGDYARDTGHLSVLEHGIYRLLLDWVYLNEKPITTEQAIRVSRGNPTETHSVLSEFFSQESDGWVHKRAQAEVALYHAKSAINRQNGQKGGRPKPTNNPVGSQTDAKHNPNQEPVTNNQEPVTKSKAATATRLPADWKPTPADLDFCKTSRPDLNPFDVADGFVDYWIAQPGAKGRKADWPATWRNWIRNQRQSKANAPPYESAKDRSRRETIEGLTGMKRNEQPNQHERDITGIASIVD